MDVLATKARTDEVIRSLVSKKLMRRSSLTLCFASALASSITAGCAGLIDDSFDDPRCQTTLGVRLIRHACSHTENGPYTDIAARSEENGRADVSTLHRPFDVTAVNMPFSLHYQASRAGAHVIFTNKRMTWDVAELEGAALEVQTNVDSVKEGTCASAAYAALVELERGQDYVLSSPDAPKRFIMFIEHAGTFGKDAFASVCP